MRPFLPSLVSAGALAALLVACGGRALSTGNGTSGNPGDGTGGTSGNGGGGGSYGSSGATGGSTTSPGEPFGANCTYPPTSNPPGCPAMYYYATPGPCAPIGLECWYPGAGDGNSDGCYSTALLACRPPRFPDDAGDVDGGDSDGGAQSGVWVASQ